LANYSILELDSHKKYRRALWKYIKKPTLSDMIKLIKKE
jgi:hypothetical protein